MSGSKPHDTDRMGASQMTIDEWRRAFAKLDYCPWPGPVPLSTNQTDQLIGRGDDIEQLVTQLADKRRLIILTGESGTGKSSFVNAGVVPTLWYLNRLPLVVNDWSGARSSTIEELIWSAFDDQLGEFPDVGGNGVSDSIPQIVKDLAGHLVEGADHSWAKVDEIARSSFVLILDQFEELIRYQESRLREALELVQKINRDTNLRVVISLRTEYSHRLVELERAADAWSLDRFDLQPIVDRQSIEKIILGGNRGLVDAITADASDRLANEWQKDAGSTKHEPGLLGLQSTLYALNRESRGRKIGTGLVEEMIKRSSLDGGTAVTSDDGTKNVGLFRYGLRSAAGYKLEVCEAACRYDGCLDKKCCEPLCSNEEHRRQNVDEYLIQGAVGVARRAVPHLSSAGYKVPIEELDLVEKALASELELLDDSPETSDSRRRAIYNYLTNSDPDDPRVDQLSVHWWNLNLGDAHYPRLRPMPRRPDYPAVDDPRSVASGPMFGRGAFPVLVEELKRAAFAVTWLLEARLVRATVSAEGNTMVSLIHDGVGAALVDWSRAGRNDPLQPLMAITASRGRTFDWREYPERFWPPLGERIREERTIANVRMTECRVVHSLFRDVVFVNCDFRGSRFENCVFEGVAFVNCLMDGVVLSECTVVGAVGDMPAKDSPGVAPSFVVCTTESEIRSFGTYQGSDGQNCREWFSDTSGFSAVPKVAVNDGQKARELKWTRPTGGLVMIGGRVSNFMLYRCSTSEGGSVAFYHVQGAGLDIVEYGGTQDQNADDPARIVIYGAMVRSLSITRDIDELGPDGEIDGNSADRRPLDVEVSKSLLLNTVFSGELKGVVTIDKDRKSVV